MKLLLGKAGCPDYDIYVLPSKKLDGSLQAHEVMVMVDVNSAEYVVFMELINLCVSRENKEKAPKPQNIEITEKPTKDDLNNLMDYLNLKEGIKH